MKVSDEATEHDNEGENSKYKQKNCSSCKDEIEICEVKHENLELEECNETTDFDVHEEEVDKNSREVCQELKNNVDMKCSNEDSREICQKLESKVDVKCSNENSHEVCQRPENNVDMKGSTEDSQGIKQHQRCQVS